MRPDPAVPSQRAAPPRAFEAARARLGDRRQAAIEAYERPSARSRGGGTRAPRRVRAFLPPRRRADRRVDAGRREPRRDPDASRALLDGRDPSPRALEIGHLPTFTDNPFVLARMAERYNEALRALARDRGLGARRPRPVVTRDARAPGGALHRLRSPGRAGPGAGRALDICRSGACSRRRSCGELTGLDPARLAQAPTSSVRPSRNPRGA